MRFSFTEDQRLFADGLRDMLDNECTPSHVRAVWDDGTGHSPHLWLRLEEMGVLSMLVPEAGGRCETLPEVDGKLGLVFGSPRLVEQLLRFF